MTGSTGNEKGSQPGSRRRNPKSSTPIWDITSLADFEAEISKKFQGDGLAEQPAGDSDEDSGNGERGCHNMTRFARVFAVLSAFAAILMVAGASTKY